MKNTNRSFLPLILCFCLFLLLGLALHLFLPDRSFSENENRYLTKMPRFTVKGLVNGSFTEDFEDYITDQFPFRDRWLDLKSRTERLLGKTENNDVFLCSGDTLISRVADPDPLQVDTALEALQTLRDNAGVPVYLALIPTAADIWSDRLPDYANTADQAAIIEDIYSRCGVNTVDIRSSLLAHRDQDIFYRTDHHWTTLGAYYGYQATAKAMGLNPVTADFFTPETVSTDFYGTVYSSSGVRWVKPDSIQIFVPEADVSLIRYDSAQGSSAPVYDRSKLETKDKYSMFLGGNTSRLVLNTGTSGGKLLVIRDSYSDCEIPFFFWHFSEIHMLDLRYFRQSVSDYLAENQFDAVLVNYGLTDFITDTSVSLLGN